MRKVAALCLLACLSLPLYFGLKRTPYAFGFESYDSYMTKHYGCEGWAMHQYVYSHVPKGSRIWYMALNPPKYYWLDYDVFPMTVQRPYDYVLLVKQDMQQQPDGTWMNTYFGIRFPAIEGKVWETDKSILYRG